MVIIANIENECNRCFKYFVQNNKYSNFKLNEKKLSHAFNTSFKIIKWKNVQIINRKFTHFKMHCNNIVLLVIFL